MTFEWADAHVNLIGHARAEVPETAGGLRCEMLFRHDTHTQALMPLNVPAVIVVAPADVEFTDDGRDGGVHPCLPDRAARVPGAAPGHLALGPVPAARGPRCGSSTSRASATPRTTAAWTWPSKGLSRRGRVVVDDGPRRPAEPPVELDEAEEAEVVPATVAELVDAITARDAGLDVRREADLRHDQPEVVGARTGLRRHGGGAGAERRHADRPGRARGAFAARLLPAPDEPGSQTTHVVDSVRDGRSFSTRQVTSDVEGRETFRMTCSFHAPEDGDSYQLPMAPRRSRRRARSRGSRRPFPSTSGSSGRPSAGRTARTSRPGAAGSAPGSPCRTTRPCTRASWPTSPT